MIAPKRTAATISNSTTTPMVAATIEVVFEVLLNGLAVFNPSNVSISGRMDRVTLG